MGMVTYMSAIRRHKRCVRAWAAAAVLTLGSVWPWVQAEGLPSEDGKAVYYTVHKETGDEESAVATKDEVATTKHEVATAPVADNTAVKVKDAATNGGPIRLLGGSATVAPGTAAPAQRINIDNYRFETIALHTDSEEGTLLLSDSPEYVADSGVLAAGTLQGKSRIYFYHVNESPLTKHIAIVLENNGDTDSRITVLRKLVTEPDTSYFKVGRELSFNEAVLLQASTAADAERALAETDKKYKKKQLAKKLKAIDANMPPRLGKGIRSAEKEEWLLPSHSRRTIFKELSGIAVGQDRLVSGIVDFTATQPVEAKVLMVDEGTGALGYSYIAPVLPADDVQLRGTFRGAIRRMTAQAPYDSTHGAGAVIIGNDTDDIFLRGVDELNKDKAMTDTGNYGVSYEVTVPTEGDRPFAIYFNPMGGAYAGAVQISNGADNKIYQIPGAYDEYIGHGTVYDTMYLTTCTPGEPVVLRFIPAGASNLPIRFLFVPLA